MKVIGLFTTLVLLLTISITACAQDARSGVQHRRIAEGVRSGELTRHETRQLARQQRRINNEKREARADGVVTAHERRKIRRHERRANRNIHRKKHNRRER